MKKRIGICLLVALMLSASLAACGDDQNGKKSTADEAASAATEANVGDDVPLVTVPERAERSAEKEKDSDKSSDQSSDQSSADSGSSDNSDKSDHASSSSKSGDAEKKDTSSSGKSDQKKEEKKSSDSKKPAATEPIRPQLDEDELPFVPV